MRHFRGTVGVGFVPVMALLIPSVVLANAGTPLMWAGAIRLVCVNIVIGVGEGLVIWLVLRTGFFRTIGIMLLANYASWIVGEVALLPLLAQAGKGFLGEQPLYHVWEFLRYVLAASFGLTVVFEWPFCFWILKLKRFRIVKSIVAVLVVNVASYAFLVHFYLDLSGTTVLTQLKQDPSLSFAANPKAWVYFIALNDGGLCRIRINGTDRHTVLSLSDMEQEGYEEPQHKWYGTTTPFVPLYVRPSAKEGLWDLGCNTNDTGIRLLRDFARQTPIQKLRGLNDDREEHDYMPNGFQEKAIYLVDSEWELWTGNWAIEGLSANKGDTKKRLALELPFLMWYSRYPTLLPGDQVVYQLGDQIVLLDLNQDLVGVITRGYSPVVVLEE